MESTSLEDIGRLNLSDIESGDDVTAHEDEIDKSAKDNKSASASESRSTSPIVTSDTPVLSTDPAVLANGTVTPDVTQHNSGSASPSSRRNTTSRGRRPQRSSTPRVTTPATPGADSGDDQSTFMAKALGLLSSDSDTGSELSDDQGKHKISYRVCIRYPILYIIS